MFCVSADCVIRLKKATGRARVVINGLTLNNETYDTIKIRLQPEQKDGWQIESIKFYPEGTHESLQEYY